MRNACSAARSRCSIVTNTWCFAQSRCLMMTNTWAAPRTRCGMAYTYSRSGSNSFRNSNSDRVLREASFFSVLGYFRNEFLADDNVAQSALGLFQLTFLVLINPVERLVVLLQYLVYRLLILFGNCRSWKDN